MYMRDRKSFSKLLSIALALLCAGAIAQEGQRALNNTDIINMVKSKLPESVVVQAIQSNPGKYDTSTTALVSLHKAGVTENELNAMIAASSKGSTGGATASGSAQNATPPVPKSRMPALTVTAGGNTQELHLEKTQLAETKTKPSSMKSLASDSVVTQAMQSGVNEAASTAAMHMNYGVGGQSVQQAGSVFSSVMAHRQPKTTYVWGVPGPASSNVLQSASPGFTVDFSRVLGVTADEYAPAIVKLTPAQNTCRIIGATQGKADARSSPAADWQIYSNFLEERVNSQAQKLAPGKYKISPASELAAGEYGIVLRPVSKTKHFSGGDVARGQGDGLMFDAVWTFQISEDAK
jgi:hypothetical protein